MDDDPLRQVRCAGTVADPGGVVHVDVGPSGEVQRDTVRRERRHRVEQFQHALVRQPVADAQHGDPAAPAQVAGIGAGLPAGRSPARPRASAPPADRARGRARRAAPCSPRAAGHSAGRTPGRVGAAASLRSRPWPTPPGGWCRIAAMGRRAPTKHDPRRDRPRRDAVHHDEPACPPERIAPTRHEQNSSTAFRAARRLGHPAMVKMPARHLIRRAPGHQRHDELGERRARDRLNRDDRCSRRTQSPTPTPAPRAFPHQCRRAPRRARRGPIGRTPRR